LVSDTKSVTKSKVPFLGDIPWIGNLFSNNNTTVQKNRIADFLNAAYYLGH